MVVGVVVYKFEMNTTSSGDIEPEFKVVVSQFSEEKRENDDSDLITIDDQYGLFFNHTTGSSFKKVDEHSKNLFVGRLKETPYKIISHYHQEMDESQYLIVTFFELDEDLGLHEKVVNKMLENFESIFSEKMQGNLKDIRFVNSINRKMKKEISYAIFQMDRLSNMEKIQKAALIFASETRLKVLEMLRKGPISRIVLREQIELIKQNPNLDLILKPFLELNLVRRDWAKGYRDRNLGMMVGEGEYLFLIKDIALARKIPKKIYEDMRQNPRIGEKYLDYVNTFYSDYDPFQNLLEESKKLAPLLLEPDVYDFMELLKTSTYPLVKIPKITSEFVEVESVLDTLQEVGVVKILEDDQERKWVCLIAEIVPLVTFPEFLVGNIVELLQSSEDSTHIYFLTEEIAETGLNLLETTYNETVEF